MPDAPRHPGLKDAGGIDEGHDAVAARPLTSAPRRLTTHRARAIAMKPQTRLSRPLSSICLIAMFCLTAAGGGAACGPITLTLGAAPGDQDLSETQVQPAERRTRDKVAIIDVSGLLLNAAPRGLLYRGEHPAAALHERLERARTDRNVRAVVLRINSPGGTVTASDVMYREVERFRQRSEKPVVVLMEDVAASGAYYLACAADHIVAHPTSVTGSIGVIVQTVSLKPALDRIGIQATTFRSGEGKDAGSPLSDMTEQHRQIIQSMVDDFYDRFVERVRDARPGIAAEHFDEVTDGRVMTGQRALELGLVDEVGDLETAWQRARKLAAIDHAHLVLYHRAGQRIAAPYMTPGSPAPGNPGSAAPASPTSGDGPGTIQINLAQINLSSDLPHGGVTFYYLWHPPD